MKYKLLAHFIRICLFFGVLIISISILQNILGEIFNTKKYWQFGDLIIGEKTSGFPMQMGMQIYMPDTIITFENAKSNGIVKRYDGHSIKEPDSFKSTDIKNAMIQKLKVGDVNSPISVSNNISIDNAVRVVVDTKNKTYRVFWTLSYVLKKVFLISIFLCIIGLINAYLKGTFLNKKSFKMISFIGIFLILAEVFECFFVFINAKIIPAIYLETAGLNREFIDSAIQFNLNFGKSIDYSNIGIGIMVLILSKVIKDAIVIKQENDLTI